MFRKCAEEALEDLCEWLKTGGEVAVSIGNEYNCMINFGFIYDNLPLSVI